MLNFEVTYNIVKLCVCVIFQIQNYFANSTAVMSMCSFDENVFTLLGSIFVCAETNCKRAVV